MGNRKLQTRKTVLEDSAPGILAGADADGRAARAGRTALQGRKLNGTMATKTNSTKKRVASLTIRAAHKAARAAKFAPREAHDVCDGQIDAEHVYRRQLSRHALLTPEAEVEIAKRLEEGRRRVLQVVFTAPEREGDGGDLCGSQERHASDPGLQHDYQKAVGRHDLRDAFFCYTLRLAGTSPRSASTVLSPPTCRWS